MTQFMFKYLTLSLVEYVIVWGKCINFVLNTDSSSSTNNCPVLPKFLTVGPVFFPRIDVIHCHMDRILFLSHHCPLFRRWLCGKVASGMDRILCGVLVSMDKCSCHRDVTGILLKTALNSIQLINNQGLTSHAHFQMAFQTGHVIGLETTVLIVISVSIASSS